MIHQMAATRITITVDEDVLDELKSRVGPGEVSGYVVEALRARLQRTRSSSCSTSSTRCTAR